MVMLWIAVALGIAACNKVDRQKTLDTVTTEDSIASPYLDLNTGKTLEVMHDTETGYVLNAETGAPVDIYINMNTMDNFYGRTNTVVNNAVRENEYGYYELNESRIRWEDDRLVVKSPPDTIAATEPAVLIAP